MVLRKHYALLFGDVSLSFYLCLDGFLFSHLLHHAKPCIYLWSTRERHKASSVESSQAQQCGAIDTLLAVDVAHILFDEKLGLDIGIIFKHLFQLN